MGEWSPNFSRLPCPCCFFHPIRSFVCLLTYSLGLLKNEDLKSSGFSCRIQRGRVNRHENRDFLWIKPNWLYAQNAWNANAWNVKHTSVCGQILYSALAKKKKKKKSHMSLREITRPSFQTSNRNMAAAVSLAWEHLARGPQIFSTRKSHVNKSVWLLRLAQNTWRVNNWAATLVQVVKFI